MENQFWQHGRSSLWWKVGTWFFESWAFYVWLLGNDNGGNHEAETICWRKIAQLLQCDNIDLTPDQTPWNRFSDYQYLCSINLLANNVVSCFSVCFSWYYTEIQWNWGSSFVSVASSFTGSTMSNRTSFLREVKNSHSKIEWRESMCPHNRKCKRNGRREIMKPLHPSWDSI